MKSFLCQLVTSSVVVLALALTSFGWQEPQQPIDAIAARKLLNETVYVELTIQMAKDRLEKRGEIYLDSELDFHDEKNLAIVITRDGARDLVNQGITDIAEHFRDKKVRVRGTVIEKEEVRRIEVSEGKQITLVKEP